MVLPCTVVCAPVPEAAAAAVLWSEERALLNPSARPKRRREWAAGRHVAKLAMSRLLDLDASSLLVLREEGRTLGRPYCVNRHTGQRVGAEVTISHADGWAIACAAPVRLGVDLVKLEALGEALEREAFVAGEIDAWMRTLGAWMPRDDVVCAAFAGKEAALKWMGTGMGVPLLSVHLRPTCDAGTQELRGLTVECGHDGGMDVLHGWVTRFGGYVAVLLAGEPLSADAVEGAFGCVSRKGANGNVRGSTEGTPGAST